MKSQPSETELFGDFFYIYWPREIDWCVHVGMLPSNSHQDHFIDYPYEPLYNLPLLGCWVKTSAKNSAAVFFSTTFTLSLECEHNEKPDDRHYHWLFPTSRSCWGMCSRCIPSGRASGLDRWNVVRIRILRNHGVPKLLGCWIRKKDGKGMYIPKQFMYAICAYIYHQFKRNVGNYTITWMIWDIFFVFFWILSPCFSGSNSGW